MASSLKCYFYSHPERPGQPGFPQAARPEPGATTVRKCLQKSLVPSKRKCISKPSSAPPTVLQVLFYPFKHHVSSTNLALARVSVSAAITLPQKQLDAMAHLQKVFGAVSLYGVLTTGAQLHSVKRPVHACS